MAFQELEQKDGFHGTDRERNLALISKLDESKKNENRTIRFITAISASNGKTSFCEQGVLKGKVVKEPRGENGFGFDEIFELENGKTLAELTDEEKNKISARKIALEKIRNKLLEEDVEMSYFDNLSENLKRYFKILSGGEEIPEFIKEYTNTPEMLKQNEIGVLNGTIYSKMYDQMWYSSLDHSIAVALIVWHFTHDKKQTISALFHDIATPTFKHTIDFMNGDYEKQESTEELTTKIIRDSKEIMSLLKRDGIKLEEVDDYHIYPIADNDTPQLAADRLEYTLSNAYGVHLKIWNLDEIEEIYSSVEVLKNEDGIDELGFTNLKLAEKFVYSMSLLSKEYREEKTLFSMQFYADILKKMSEKGLITVSDLYKYSEKEMVEKIENCNEDKIAENYKIWKEAKDGDVHASDEKPLGKYVVTIRKIKG